MVRRLADPPMAGHGFGPELIGLVLRLVLVAGVSLRGTSRVLATIGEALGLALPVPCWSTGRLWLLRLGHAMLTRELAQADDWAWLIDHSVQIGQEKCLVILGVRLDDLPLPGQSLRHEDHRLDAGQELDPRPGGSGVGKGDGSHGAGTARDRQ